MKDWKSYIPVYIFIISVVIAFIVMNNNIYIVQYSVIYLLIYFILIIGYWYLYNNYISKKIKGINVKGFYPEYKKVFYVLNGLLLSWIIVLGVVMYPVVYPNNAPTYEVELGGDNMSEIDFDVLIEDILDVTNSTDGNIYRLQNPYIGFYENGDIKAINIDFLIISGNDVAYYTTVYVDDNFYVVETSGYERALERMEYMVILNEWISGLNDLSYSEITNYYSDVSDINHYYITLPFSNDLNSWIVTTEEEISTYEYSSGGEKTIIQNSTDYYDKDDYIIYSTSILIIIDEDSDTRGDQELNIVYPKE